MKRVGKNWIYKFKRWLNTWTIWYDMISFNTIQLCHSVNLWSSTWIGKTILYNLTGLKKTSRSSELAIGPLGNLPFRWGAPKVLWESASWKRSMIVSMIDGWLDPWLDGGWWMDLSLSVSVRLLVQRWEMWKMSSFWAKAIKYPDIKDEKIRKECACWNPFRSSAVPASPIVSIPKQHSGNVYRWTWPLELVMALQVG